ncbi:MAG: hypothetical protein ACE5K7_04740 [Phycisphaerae bacterium]
MTDAELDLLLRRVRVNLILARLIRLMLLAALVAAGASVALANSTAAVRLSWLGLLAVLGCWMWLVWQAARSTEQTSLAAELIGQGRLSQAEALLRAVVGRFSIMDSSRLICCHHLAVVTRALGRHAQAARIAAVVARGRWFEGSGPLVLTASTLLADCLLSTGDIDGAGRALARLKPKAMSLAERLAILPTELRYELASQRYGQRLERLAETVRLSELLEAPQAAEVNGLLAVACHRARRPAEARFLARRAMLYHDLDQLPDHCGVLREVPAIAQRAD